jgi:DNA gyrase/topoisomerase IV subunit B
MADQPSGLEHVRLRPAMYVGNTGFWGFINYVVCAYRVLIHWGATTIHFARADGKFVVSSNAKFPAEPDDFNPFEETSKSDDRRHVHACFDALVINALSSEFIVTDGRSTYAYRRGVRIEQSRQDGAATGLTLRFAPDDEIFTVTGVAPAIMQSYLHRMSFLFPRIRFSLETSDGRIEYSSPGGMADLFRSIAAPYQLLHEPIRLTGTDDDFEMDLVFALHSWSEEMTWTFANAGRAADGGTHDEGLRAALQTFSRQATGKKANQSGPGFLAVMSFRYPKVRYEGCIKGKIANEELEGKTRDLIGKLLKSIDRTQLVHLKSMTRFQIADFW